MARPSQTSFGDLLKGYRAAAGLTQEELATQARLSARAVSDLERGIKHRPHAYTVQRLAHALHLTEAERAAFEAASRAGVQAPPARPMTTRPYAASAAGAPRIPLVGRARERALLQQHLSGTGPPVLFLAGEPGIGKSRLLAEAEQQAQTQGLQVLAGGCQRRGGQEPYAPLVGALERYLLQRAPAQLQTDLHDCAWLVRLLPELAVSPIAPLPAWSLTAEQEYRLVVKAVRQFLANIAGPAGTLVLLDDLQWAGADALELLDQLVRSPLAPLRVVGAYRDTEMSPSHPLAGALADLAQAGLAAQHTLHPLTTDEASALLAQVWGPDPRVTAAQERVVERAGGVPFVLLSCAQAVAVTEGAGRPMVEIPWDVAQSVRQRVAVLPPTAQEVLGIAAMVGRMVPPHLLSTVATQSEGEVLAALDVACSARLLVEEGRAYRFAHDVIREVIEADLGAARQMALHRRIAESLEQSPEPASIELLAYHFGQSSVPDKAVPYLERSGDAAAARYANATAAGYYRDAIARLDELGRLSDAARVREKLGGVLATQAHYAAALSVLDQAAAWYRQAGEDEHAGRIVAQMGRIHAHQGTIREGIERLEPVRAALTHVAAAPSHSLAALEAALAELYGMDGQLTVQLAMAQRAADLARALGDEGLQARALERQGLALLALRRTPEALGVLQDAAQQAEAIRDLDTLCDALDEIAVAQCLAGAFATSRVYMERALSIAEQLEDPAEMAFMHFSYGWLLFAAGEWAQARGELERALELSRGMSLSWQPAIAASRLAHLCLAEGDWEEAARHLDEAVALNARGHTYDSAWWVTSALAEHDLVTGHTESALARLTALMDQLGTQEWFVVPTLILLARTHLALGDRARASDVAAQAVVHAQAAHNRLDLVDALWVQAHAAVQQADWGAATRALDEGLTLAQGMPYPLAEARLLHIYGMMHAQQGDLHSAQERLQAARALFLRLGARPEATHVESALARIPGGAVST